MELLLVNSLAGGQPPVHVAVLAEIKGSDRMKDALSSALDSPLDRRATSSEQPAHSTSWTNESTKRGLKRLRAELSRIPEVAAFARLSRSNKRSWPDLLFAAVAMIGGIALVIHGSNQTIIESVAGTGVLVLGLICVFALNHEAWHGHLSTSERVNNVLSGWILSPLLVADFGVQQQNHLQHHAYLGEDSDPDGQIYRMSTKTFVLMLVGRALVIPYLLKVAGLRKEASANRTQRLLRGWSLLRIALIHSIWFVVVSGGAWLVSGNLWAAATAVFFGYFLPLILASFMIAFRGHREHYVDESTGKTVTCDTDCVFIERWLIAGGRFNWHACHHLFPEIPQRRLPQFAKLIRSYSDISRHYDGLGSPIAARATFFSSVPDSRVAALRSASGF